MLARVKESYRWSSLVALIGREFVKGEWRPVPAGMEEEAEANEFLEVKEAASPTPPVPEGGEGEDAPEKEIEASPAAAKLAEEHGIDLASIKGTGSGGNITKPDVQAAIDALASESGEEEEAELTKVKANVSTAAIELAEEHGIDLAEVEGTGAGGNIIKPDVEKVIAALSEEGENSEVS